MAKPDIEKGQSSPFIGGEESSPSVQMHSGVGVQLMHLVHFDFMGRFSHNPVYQK